MRISKITFRQAKDEDPSVEQNQNSHTIIGIITSIIFLLLIIFPYISSYFKGKIGINNLTNNKYNLVSTALRHVDKKIQYLLLIMGFIFSTIFLNYKGFFLKLDRRLIVPFSIYGILICIFLLTIVIPEKFVLHNIIGIISIIFAILLLKFMKDEYKSEYVNNDIKSLDNLYIALIICVCCALLVGVFNIYNNYIRKGPKLFPNYIPLVRNLLGIFEICIFIITSISFIIIIDYPPLQKHIN